MALQVFEKGSFAEVAIHLCQADAPVLEGQPTKTLITQRLREITREAILFAAQHEILALTQQGDIVIGRKRQSVTERRTGLFTIEARRCVDRAGFIGRWFAAAGTTATIYAAWGVAP